MGKPTYEDLMHRFSQVELQTDADVKATSGDWVGQSTASITEHGSAAGQEFMELEVEEFDLGQSQVLETATCIQEDAPSTRSDAHSPISFSTWRPSPPSTPATLLLPLSSSCSLSSLPEGPSPRHSSDNGSSDYSSGEDQTPQPVMCTPKTAKELSEASHSYYAVTDFDRHDDLIPEDEPLVPGMVLQGYLDGKPVYYNNTGIYPRLKAMETNTAIGLRYVPQPIESCFGQTNLDALDGDSGSGSTDSGYGSLHEHVPPNRVFCNEWITVQKSPLGGYGIFAAKDIPEFTHFLLEQPFIRTSHCSQLADKYDKLSEEEKLVFDGLHGFDRTSDDPLKKRWNANSFFLHRSEAVFAIAANFNHACHSKRNTQYRWDGRRRVMTFTATGAITRGEELLISYGEFRDALFEKFGFICRCGGCEGQFWEVPSQLVTF